MLNIVTPQKMTLLWLEGFATLCVNAFDSGGCVAVETEMCTTTQADTFIQFHGHSTTTALFLSVLLLIISHTLSYWNTAHSSAFIKVCRCSLFSLCFEQPSLSRNTADWILWTMSVLIQVFKDWPKLLEWNCQLQQHIWQHEVSFHSADSRLACVAPMATTDN